MVNALEDGAAILCRVAACLLAASCSVLSPGLLDAIFGFPDSEGGIAAGGGGTGDPTFCTLLVGERVGFL